MRVRTLAVVFLMLASVPLGAGQVPTADDSRRTVTDQPTTAASDSSSGGAGGDPTSTKFTRLYVDGDRTHTSLKPGESRRMNITVENGEDGPVQVRPHVYVPPTGQRPLSADWVELSTTESVTLTSGEERTFTVTISVPEDAKVGRYGGQIAITNETVTYPGRPARPVHAERIGVEVWKEPTITIAGSFGHLQVEAGETVTHEIVVENSGDSTVPLNPQVSNRGRSCHGNCPDTLDRSWLDIDAPSEVPAGEEATVTVTVAPPEDAERGRYDVELDLGLKDPARDERDTYWQQLNLNVEIWQQPAEPFETTFGVTNQTENVTLTLSPRSGGHRTTASTARDSVGFDVTFVGPDGGTVDAEYIRVSEQGFVDLSGDTRRAGRSDGEYSVRGGERQFVYRLENPTDGAWKVRVHPKNTIGFGYEVTRYER